MAMGVQDESITEEKNMEDVKDTMMEEAEKKTEDAFEEEEDDDLNFYSEDYPPLAGVLIKYILFVLALVVVVVLLIWLFWQPERREHTENSSDVNSTVSEQNLHELAMECFDAAGEAVIRHEEYLKELALQEQARLEAEAQAQKEAEENSDYGMNFTEVEEVVTAKDVTNLRDIPSQGEESMVMTTLQNGQTATRIGISNTGWSKLEYNGEIYYAVSSLLTTDLTVKPTEPEPEEDDGIKTVFTECNEKVSPKIEVNLRTLPSVTNPDSVVVATIWNGIIVTRTGINTDVGWSRVEYNGQTLYCISSYVYVVE